jgi:flagellar hook assembly protein FlgD
LPEQALVSLQIFDALGRLVTTLVDRDQAPGVYRLEWKGDDRLGLPVGSGVYLYRLEAGSFSKTRRMVMLK